MFKSYLILTVPQESRWTDNPPNGAVEIPQSLWSESPRALKVQDGLVVLDLVAKAQLEAEQQAIFDAERAARQALRLARQENRARLAGYRDQIDAATTLNQLKSVLKDLARDLKQLSDEIFID